MLEWAKAIHEAIGIESPRAFVAVFAILGFFLFGCAGWLIDRGYRVKLKEQAARITTQAVSDPLPNRIEQDNYKTAKTALLELGPDVVTVLKHLRNHSTLTFNDGSHVFPPLPQGMDAKHTRTILDACAERNLVTRELFSRASGGVAPITGCTYKIADGMKAAIERLLNENL
jgi:hypothetical protein